MAQTNPISNFSFLPVSIVVPTYKENQNIPHLVARIEQMMRDNDMQVELIFMDDQSRDGSAETVAAMNKDWVKFIEREGPRGLSLAVIDGFRAASHPILVCMDCDLSHPPEKIPQMMFALGSGQEMVIGSRYVPGGSTDDDWGILRWINSKVATALARPLTKISDPMSGFFALRKEDFNTALALDPIGYKIALELIVKCGFINVGEVAIHFSDRIHGESKLSLREQLSYLRHVRRLYIHRFENAMYFIQFLMVGASGVVVNLAVLTLLMLMGAANSVSLAGGIAVSLVSNFVLNRRYTFAYAKDENVWRQFAGFLVASGVGMVVNYLVALYLVQSVLPEAVWAVYASALAGIAAGMAFNFVGNRYVVFRKKHLKK